MSMSPDDPFLQSLLGPNGSLSSGMNSPLMGIAMGLLQAGGPSRMPTSLGQALGAGLQTGAQFQGQGIQNALQNIELQKAKTQLGFLNGMNSPIQGTGDPNDPTSDPTYQKYLRGAMAGIPGMGEAANNQLVALRSREHPATPEEMKKFFPNGVQPGQTVVIDGYGNPKIMGDSAIKMIPMEGPNGTMVNVPWDTRTNKVVGPSASLQPKDYSQPLSAAMEQQAQAVATYRQMPPTVSSRYPGAADIRGRANYLLSQNGGNGLDDTTFPAKKKAMDSLAAGPDYKQNSAFSTIQTHFDTLKEAFAAADNGDMQQANKLIQWTGKQFGKSAPQNLKLVSDIVNGELARVLAQGGQVTDAVRAEANNMLAPYFSKGQMAEGIKYAQQLIAGKMNTSYINARARHIPDDVFLAGLTPEAREQLQDFRATHPDQFSPQGQQSPPGAASQNTGNWVYDPSTGTMKQQ